MEDVIARLVGELDADSGEVAEDAQHALIALGPRVLDPLIAAAPGLGSFGQLCAIEVFTALGDPRPGDALTRMPGSDNSVVRQWAAEALADLGIHRAVPCLSQAYEAFRRRGEDPDDCEGGALRRALTELGARDVVLPARAAALRHPVPGLGSAWPTARLADAIEDLADHGQAVLSFKVWQIGADGGVYGGHGPDIDWSIDRGRPWPQIVAECREWALLAAEATDTARNLVATICWIDAADL
ncbi:HEAT repeat domain-containing protein [Embleya sp. NPDC127516]|uniref:HEAT repeat domain-containing protein n=1 Tax=Embleya sp. NPDC127516 TaxID=3363990 RepID=UPI003811B234